MSLAIACWCVEQPAMLISVCLSDSIRALTRMLSGNADRCLTRRACPIRSVMWIVCFGVDVVGIAATAAVCFAFCVLSSSQRQ